MTSGGRWRIKHTLLFLPVPPNTNTNKLDNWKQVCVHGKNWYCIQVTIKKEGVDEQYRLVDNPSRIGWHVVYPPEFCEVFFIEQNRIGDDDSWWWSLVFPHKWGSLGSPHPQKQSLIFCTPVGPYLPENEAIDPPFYGSVHELETKKKKSDWFDDKFSHRTDNDNHAFIHPDLHQRTRVAFLMSSCILCEWFAEPGIQRLIGSYVWLEAFF